jgi:hypothetical protein
VYRKQDHTIDISKMKLSYSTTLYAVACFMAQAEEVEERKLRSSSSASVEADNSSFQTRVSYPECAANNMTGEQCVAYLGEEIGNDHEVGPVDYKIVAPRDASVLTDTYWMVGIESNSYGKVACRNNGAQTSYPFLWSLSEENDFPVPSLDCSHMTVGECCLDIRRQAQLIGKDLNDSCLACHVRQAPLEPIFDKPGVHFQDSGLYDPLDEDNECYPGYVHKGALAIIKQRLRQRLATAYLQLHNFMAFPTCDNDTMETLLQSLYDAARVVEEGSDYKFQALLGRLSCEWCFEDSAFNNKNSNSSLEQDLELMTVLGDLADYLSQAAKLAAKDDTMIALAERTLTVYTDSKGTVVEPVTFGTKQ